MNITQKFQIILITYYLYENKTYYARFYLPQQKQQRLLIQCSPNEIFKILTMEHQPKKNLITFITTYQLLFYFYNFELITKRLQLKIIQLKTTLSPLKQFSKTEQFEFNDF